MSVRVMSLVWGINLPDSEKLVLLALADSANDEGGCWPSMRTLTDKCSKSDRTIQTAIKSLVEKGHLSRQENPGKGCFYTVHPVQGHGMNGYHPPQFHYVYRVTDQATGEFYVGARTCLVDPKDDPYLGSGEWAKEAKMRGAPLSKEVVQVYPSREALGVGEAGHTRAVFGQSLCRNRKVATPKTLSPYGGLTPEVVYPRMDCPPKRTTQTPEAVSDKPSRTIKISSVAKATSPRNAFPMPIGTDPQCWRDFLENRKRKRLSNTATAHRKLLADLDRLSDDEWPPPRLIEHAAARGWGGIYDPREQRNGRMGRHQSANGISATVSAAIDVFGYPDAGDERRVPRGADEMPRLGGPGGHG